MIKNITQCKDCKYYVEKVQMTIYGSKIETRGICFMWGDGCVTKENGYCHQAVRKTKPEKEKK